jgi:hypothetical protein
MLSPFSWSFLLKGQRYGLIAGHTDSPCKVAGELDGVFLNALSIPYYRLAVMHSVPMPRSAITLKSN